MSDRRNVKIFGALALFALVVLGAVAVWCGALNQDEGWYLYAANLVAEGKVPYADFAYTQGPVMPIVYALFAGIWKSFGLLGARLFTLAIGLLGVAYAVLTARRLRGNRAALVALFLLGCNLYHLYYLAIPKAYALASLFVAVGFYLLTWIEDGRRGVRFVAPLLAGAVLALAAGTRISLGAILAVVGFGLLVGGLRGSFPRWAFLWFGLGGALVLLLVYGPFLLHPATRAGLFAAQAYHASRGGFDPVFTVGSLSRLVRWYLPVFIVLGLGIAMRIAARATGSPGDPGKRDLGRLLLLSFLAVFAVQILAPFPYEDYQVPVMGLLAVYAAVAFLTPSTATASTTTPILYSYAPLLVFGLAYASAFSSPLLEKWMTNGQDRFWSLKKDKTELAQLRDVAKAIEALDPGGTELLTQDTYLAVETNRKVPKGLEMGPFAILSDAEWRTLLANATPKVAALSGYTFAIEPPVCSPRPMEAQLAYWSILKSRYDLAFREEAFGQNATTLLVLKRK